MITAQEFMQQLFGDLGALVASEDELREVWSEPDRRERFLQRLTDMGYDSDRLDDMRRLIDAPNSDIFDVLAYVRFELAPLARSQRASRRCVQMAWTGTSARCAASWIMCWELTSSMA
jgi:type I restriction enzyme R subunit